MTQWMMDTLTGSGLAAPRAGRLESTRELLTDPDAVRSRLVEFGGAGWLCLTDRVVPNFNGVDLPDGVPLHAEVTDGERSLHLRQHREGWVLYTIARGEGDDQLIFNETFVAIGGGRLQYEVAWRRDLEDRTWRPWCARFVGIEAGG